MPSYLHPFKAIPGPKPLPLIGNIWRYLPIIGEFKINRMHLNAERMRATYGDVVREVVVGDRVVVHVFKPEDIEQVLRHEGRYPIRISHRALLKYRKERPALYNTGGLFPTNGRDWQRLRALVQKPMLQPGAQDHYVGALSSICDDFVDKIKATKVTNLENGIQDELYKWALECTGIIALDRRLGCLDAKLEPDSEAQRLIESAAKTHHSVMITENGLPFWKYWDTKAYKTLTEAQDCMAGIVNKYLDDTSQGLTANSVLSKFKQSLEKSDIFTMVLDMFLAGIDTTAYATAFSLYDLTQNEEKQIKLRRELERLLPETSTEISAATIKTATYLKACVKESLRLHPIALGIGRVLPEDIVLSDYLIPKNTMIIMHNQVACKQAKYFANPDDFVPERWIKGDVLEEKPNPFLWLPFGYGPRMCIGRRFAELEIYIILCKIFREFKVSYVGEPLDCYTRLINVPDQPLKFVFKNM